MVVSDAINKSLEDIENRYEIEEDEKKKKQLNKEFKKLLKVFYKALYKEWTELKKNDIGGIYEDLEPKSKKIISDKEYVDLMEKWGKIVGEKLLYPLEQEYQDRRNVVIEATKDDSPEEKEKALKRFEYEWEHREEWAKRKKDLERDHRNYMRMINNMTPEEYHNFMMIRDPDRLSYFKNASEVKTKDE